MKSSRTYLPVNPNSYYIDNALKVLQHKYMTNGENFLIRSTVENLYRSPSILQALNADNVEQLIAQLAKTSHGPRPILNLGQSINYARLIHAINGLVRTNKHALTPPATSASWHLLRKILKQEEKISIYYQDLKKIVPDHLQGVCKEFLRTLLPQPLNCVEKYVELALIFHQKTQGVIDFELSYQLMDYQDSTHGFILNMPTICWSKLDRAWVADVLASIDVYAQQRSIGIDDALVFCFTAQIDQLCA